MSFTELMLEIVFRRGGFFGVDWALFRRGERLILSGIDDFLGIFLGYAWQVVQKCFSARKKVFLPVYFSKNQRFGKF